MIDLKTIELHKIRLSNGTQLDLKISYELYGKPLHSAPIVLINHSLTGNSTVTGEMGWWNDVVGENKIIDTLKYTVLSINVPGNGYDGLFFDNASLLTVQDVASIFLKALKLLNINRLYAIIGGSIGGAVTWNMAYLSPNLAQYIIPIATHWKASDWVISTTHIQEIILNHSENPLHDARKHAMLTYRTPQSLSLKFNNAISTNANFEVLNWLDHHGEKLSQRFELKAYKLMNHLLKSINVTDSVVNLSHIQSEIHLIGINSDLLFVPDDIVLTYELLKPLKQNIFYHPIDSIHGHDAFLIEYEQLNKILLKIF